MNEFTIRLKLLRETKDVSLNDVAIAIDSTKAQLSRYERGENEPSRTVLIKLADYYGVTLDWICGCGERYPIGYRGAENNAEMNKLQEIAKILQQK